jgi:hypothetical protein
MNDGSILFQRKKSTWPEKTAVSISSNKSGSDGSTPVVTIHCCRDALDLQLFFSRKMKLDITTTISLEIKQH